MRKLTVLIIGAGTGGLCLAHGLRAAGIEVRLFERDRTPTDRQQGYRLTINASGARALESSLPPASFARYIAASARVSTAVTFLDHRLRRLLSIDLPETNQSAPHAPRPIGRAALRQVLLEGLHEVVEFGKTFVSFESLPPDRIIARFEDGSSVEGDVLVGADGASSRVRGQLLPHARRIDTGVVGISGKLPLDAAARAATPPAFFKGPTLILGPRGCFMFGGAVEYPPQHGADHDRSEYIMWGFSIHRQLLGLEAPAEALSGEAARAAVLSQIADFSPHIGQLVERAQQDSLTAYPVKSSVPVAPWATGRVTLLGDALHNMTPFRGIGANTALRDAILLRDALLEVHGGREELLPALAGYERQMIGYGFDAVRASLAQMNRVHARSPIKRFATRTMLRVLDALPGLRARVMNLGEG
jgi:2-polyprenyl-6-methoxyphenol hydroxylase-like FAD-dependent oxidoreductase